MEARAAMEIIVWSRLPYALAVVLAASVVTSASALDEPPRHPPVTAAAAQDKAQLTRLSDDWDKAIVRKDQAAIAGNMAEDFRQIDGRGNLETKTSFVAGLMDPQLAIDPYTVEDFEVRLYGDTALLSGRTDMTGRYAGKPFRSSYRYIDVYVRRDGVWKIVSVQITRLPEAAPDRK